MAMLSDNQKHILSIIYKVYDRTSNGCKSIGIVSDKKDLDFLINEGYIFETNNGFFPSTKGQEYIKLKNKYKKYENL